MISKAKDIILIIGASSEIGIDLIKNINEDAIILAHYNNSHEQIIELQNNLKNEIIPMQANLSIEDDVFELINEIELKYGIPTKIVHLAAPKFRYERFRNLKWEDFQEEVDISLKSLILILNSFLPKMAKQKKGKIVCMLSSVTINIPPKQLSSYITVKYALLGLVKSLASEYVDKNIQINALSPSMIETKFLEDISEKFVELNAYNHPLKRNATVGDIVPIIKLLLSEDSNYMNGLNIPITGGGVF